MPAANASESVHAGYTFSDALSQVLLWEFLAALIAAVLTRSRVMTAAMYRSIAESLSLSYRVASYAVDTL